MFPVRETVDVVFKALARGTGHQSHRKTSWLCRFYGAREWQDGLAKILATSTLDPTACANGTIRSSSTRRGRSRGKRTFKVYYCVRVLYNRYRITYFIWNCNTWETGIGGGEETPSSSRGRDSLSLGCARSHPGVGTHSSAGVPRIDIHSESPGVPDPPRPGASVINT